MNNFNDIHEVENMDDEELFELLDQIQYDDGIDIDSLSESMDMGSGEYCKNCKTSDYVANDSAQGTMVCTYCGTVLSNLFDSNPEWRNYEGDDKNTVNRCSGPTNFFFPQSSLGTSIAGSSWNKLKMLQGWNSMPYKERSLFIVCKYIHEKCEKGKILKCIEDEAKILYKNISECKHNSGKNKGKPVITRGLNRTSLIAACLFFACKRKGDSSSHKEIADLFQIDYKDITKGCKTFIRLIKIKKVLHPFVMSL